MSFSDKEIADIRADTPACAAQIHFNNAGAALMPGPVFNAMQSHLELERDYGGYAAESLAAEKISGFYPALAKLLNAKPSEIAFASNHTRAWEMGLRAMDWQAGDRLLIHDSSYTSNYLAFLHLVKTKGIVLDRIPSNESGIIDLERVAPLITKRTKAIALTHMPTFDGSIQPAAALGKIANDHNLLYIVDACQSVGQAEIDVQAIGCDLLAGTGRKWLRGPRGTGFLYVRESALEKLSPPLIDNISAAQTSDTEFKWAKGAKRFETYERHVAGQIGLSEAAKYAIDLRLPRIEDRVKTLAKTLRETLTGLPVIVLDKGEALSGIVTFRSERKSAKDIIDALWERRIAVSYISPHQVTERPDAVRASIHYYNTQDEIDKFCRALKQIIT
ncbi:aminotransferase class V-fold PLP-dependent enzyme [Litorimonas sp.]|uniref:aminotransferase class V-fold PLP-dependent enzyme n=1 Tax=Litorimonas sp. TaxID=1892381 RepID=UPI003A8A48B4